jgi:hypothetical protein
MRASTRFFASTALFSQSGMYASSDSLSSALIAPQSECPQITISFTLRWRMAYSRTDAKFQSCIGAMFPTFRCTKRVPGMVWVMFPVWIRESEHPIQRTDGLCPLVSSL